MTGKGFSDRTADNFVYRVTREERQRDWNRTDFTWIQHVKLCSKRSAAQQAAYLAYAEAEAAKHGVEPSERLVSIERAPYSSFEDVTAEFRLNALLSKD